jgi:hypothetical protein
MLYLASLLFVLFDQQALEFRGCSARMNFRQALLCISRVQSIKWEEQSFFIKKTATGVYLETESSFQFFTTNILVI